MVSWRYEQTHYLIRIFKAYGLQITNSDISRNVMKYLYPYQCIVCFSQSVDSLLLVVLVVLLMCHPG